MFARSSRYDDSDSDSHSSDNSRADRYFYSDDRDDSDGRGPHGNDDGFSHHEHHQTDRTKSRYSRVRRPKERWRRHPAYDGIETASTAPSCSISLNAAYKILPRIRTPLPHVPAGYNIRVSDVCAYFASLLDKLPELRGWRPVSFLGAGASGAVVEMRNVADPSKTRVVKLVTNTTDDEFARECESQRIFYEKAQLALPVKCYVYRDWQCDADQTKCTLYVLETSKVDGILKQWMTAAHTDQELDLMTQKLLELLSKLKQANLTHGDFHFDNIAMVRSSATSPAPDKLVLIDFGYSNTKKADTLVDVTQWIRTTFPPFQISLGRSPQEAHNYERVRNHLLRFALQTFPDAFRGVPLTEKSLIDLANRTAVAYRRESFPAPKPVPGARVPTRKPNPSDVLPTQSPKSSRPGVPTRPPSGTPTQPPSATLTQSLSATATQEPMDLD